MVKTTFESISKPITEEELKTLQEKEDLTLHDQLRLNTYNIAVLTTLSQRVSELEHRQKHIQVYKEGLRTTSRRLPKSRNTASLLFSLGQDDP